MNVYIKQARLSWQHHLVFDDLNLHLPSQQWTCILGQSGVGKSTLVKLLAGIISPDANVSADIHCCDGKPLAGRVAWMGQQDLLLPWLSVLDNVLLGPRLRQRRKATREQRQQALGLLQEVGLTHLQNRYPATLSGGQRQRIALARTLMENCPLICMDEPFSALDAINRIRLQDLAVRLLHDRTVLMITHEPMEALRLGDQVRVLQGSPASLSPPIIPANRPPRPVDQPDLLRLQGELLKELASSGDSGIMDTLDPGVPQEPKEAQQP